MLTILEISETVFFIVASLALISFGIMTIIISMAGLSVVKFFKKCKAKLLEKISVAELIKWLWSKGRKN